MSSRVPGAGIVPPAGGGASLPVTSALLKGDGAGGAAAATAGTDYPGLATGNTFTEAQTINTVKSAAGTAFSAQATAPAQAASSQAGAAASLVASDAVAGSSNAGAANGGAVTIAAGDAKRLTSGDGNGGDVTVRGGALIGSGSRGQVKLQTGGASGPVVSVQSGWVPGTSADLESATLVLRSGGTFIIFPGNGKVMPGFTDSQDFGDNSTRWRHAYLSGVVEHLQISTPAAPNTNCAKSYAKDVSGTAELFGMDEGGTETQQTPHAIGTSPFPEDLSDPFPYIFQDTNYYIGVTRYINISRLAYLLQRLFPKEPIVAERDLPQEQWWDWDAEQNKLQAAYMAARAAEIDAREKAIRQAAIARRASVILAHMRAEATAAGCPRAEVDALELNPEFLAKLEPLAADLETARAEIPNRVRPVADIRKPAPAWLKPRMAADYDNTQKPRPNWKQRLFAWLMK